MIQILVKLIGKFLIMMDLLLLLNLTNFLQVDARLKKAQTAKDYCFTEVTKLIILMAVSALQEKNLVLILVKKI